MSSLLVVARPMVTLAVLLALVVLPTLTGVRERTSVGGPVETVPSPQSVTSP